MTEYFVKNSPSLDIKSENIRNCQRGAYYATLAHFSRTNTPCLIGLPTGSGKTALMMALCFGLQIKRALIVTPATILRHQTSEKFKSLEDLIQANAIPSNLPKPDVFEAIHEFQSLSDWNHCLSFDVTVATPNVTSPMYQRVSKTPKGLFDVIFIDEAHHAPAESWSQLLQAFHTIEVKAILMTGTPYRRDRVEISADLIYDYPISLAMQDNIFAPVKFANIRHKSQNRDKSLARKCLQVRNTIHSNYGEWPLVLIKTDRKNHADKLCKLYYDLGLKVRAIHTDYSDAENKDTIASLKSRDLEGIVAVGMIGEGLDIPKLKLAVFHRNPQSLPHTIQLIGRLARAGTKIDEGTVIGYSDDFSRETFRLYDANPDWLKLIPYFERKLISGRVDTNIQKPLSHDENFLFDSDLNPYFSISALSFGEDSKSADLSKLKNWKNSTINRHDSIVYLSNYYNDTVVIVTRTLYQPDWIISGGYSRILQEKFDLHLLYQNKKIVLEYSTEPLISSLLRLKLFGEKLSKVSKEQLNQVLKDGDGSYVVVGLKNSSGISYGNPSYKMLMGREAQVSIQNTDTKVFYPGHALMRLNRSDRASEIRGIAYKNSRIWALRRANLKAFRDWCMTLSSALLGKKPALLPGLERLRSTHPISSFPGKPIAMVQNSYLLNRLVRFELDPLPEIFISSVLRDFVIQECDKTQLKFSIEEIEAEFVIEIDVSSNLHTKKLGGKDYTIIVDSVGGVIKRYPIVEFLDEFPPQILFPDGTSIADGVCSSPIEVPTINENVLIPLDWNDCDIHSEEEDTDNGISTHNFIEGRYIPSQGKATLIIHDHSSYEVADTISIDLILKHICLYHMKAVKTIKGVPQDPGRRKSDLHEVFAQAITSSKWIRNTMLADELLRRVNERKATRLVKGSKSDVANFASDYSPASYSFEVVVVQPALIGNGLQPSLKDMIASTQDYVIAAGGDFTILCSP